MRILFVTPTLMLGGSERLTAKYAIGLHKRGHEVAIAHGAENLQRETLEEEHVDVFEIADWVPGVRNLREWTSGLRRVMRDYRPDVVHAQSVASAVAVRMVSRSTPMLVTMHGIPKSDEALAAFILRAANVRLTAVSEQTAAGIERHFWSPPIAILNAGVDVEQLREDSLAEGKIELIGDPKLCCVARLEAQKGMDIMLRALAIVVREFPNVGLTWVGEGTLLDDGLAQAAELGISEHVHFMGGVPNAAPYIAAADIMVLSSRWEGLPVTALESLALERPMIATAVNGTPTVIIDGETGWLAPPEDPEAFAAAVIDCAKNPEEAARRARAGHELIDAGFTSERMLDRLEGLLIDLRRGHTRMPPTKPRLYYRAARAHQSARITAARGRGALGTPSWEGVRILGYHRVSDDDDVYAVTPAAFHAHMSHLVSSGVKVVRLSDALDLLEEPVREAYACVTFDDGYLDNLDQALPVLEELEIPATVFVVGDVLEKRVNFNWYADAAPPAITTDDLPRLLSSGVLDIQAHSRTHARLTMISDVELRREVAGSKEQIERHLPYQLTSFCYPGGLYEEREMAAVLAAGFRAGVTTLPGVNGGGVGLGELHRTLIKWGDTLSDFDAKLAGVLDRPSKLASTLHARRTRPAKSPVATRASSE